MKLMVFGGEVKIHLGSSARPARDFWATEPALIVPLKHHGRVYAPLERGMLE